MAIRGYPTNDDLESHMTATDEGIAIEGRRAIESYDDMRDRTVWDCCGPRYWVKIPVRELRSPVGGLVLHRTLCQEHSWLK